MPRSIRVAAIQMLAQPAPPATRRARAAALVARAAAQGATLVVLPELFATGYTYPASGALPAEPWDGPTVRWLRATASQHRLYLAGSLILREGDEYFNALLLVAPDGRTWRYDKTYPWGWERAYFRGRPGITIAQTPLGAIGMLVCWDTAHRALWRAYAGKVDLLLIAACPPDVSRPRFRFRNGAALELTGLGWAGRALHDSAARLFWHMVPEQSAWLGVPAVMSGCSGRLDTTVPRPHASLWAYVPLMPRLAFMARHGPARLVCPFLPTGAILDANGRRKAQTPPTGDAVAVAQVELADPRPHPRGPQPPRRLSWLAYWASDILLPRLMQPVYTRNRKAGPADPFPPADEAP